MKQRTKNTIVGASMIAMISSPLWLSAAFSVANVHDMVTVDRDGHIMSQPVLRNDYDSSDAISFDKTGNIIKTIILGNYISVRTNHDGIPKIFSNIALPKAGAVVTTEVIRPDSEFYAAKLHDTACNAVRQNDLQGYDALNCK